jgi:hypothetical protein
MKNLLFIIHCSLLFIFLSGCGGPPRPAGLPPLHPCTVTLKQDGKPLSGAMTIFYSSDPAFQWSSGGISDANGTVKVMTHSQFPGVPVGEYKMTVLKMERFQERPPQPIPGGDGTIMTPGSPVTVYRLVEKQYSDVKTTPLLVIIKQGKNHFDFDAGKPVKEEEKIVF